MPYGKTNFSKKQNKGRESPAANKKGSGSKKKEDSESGQGTGSGLNNSIGSGIDLESVNKSHSSECSSLLDEYDTEKSSVDSSASIFVSKANEKIEKQKS